MATPGFDVSEILSSIGPYPEKLKEWGLSQGLEEFKDAALVQNLCSAYLSGWVSMAGFGMTHGIWDHFKGGVYLSQSVVRFAATGEPLVVYVSLGNGTMHGRLARDWNEVVKWPDGKYRSRFIHRGPDLSISAPDFKVTP